MGSTSCAITTREAFLASMRATMWLRPYLTKRGFLSLAASFCSAVALAIVSRRSFFSALLSGRYLHDR